MVYAAFMVVRWLGVKPDIGFTVHNSNTEASAMYEGYQ